ncbi:hypothetical protein ACFFX1_41645 [Dactylosporangium sucinum]|uniref:Uncharacterized protein n=1 Tax=Dactylosporangium sucinum TaxID=1424081 RepID=A0A917X342_9ACTN|nr:hypothetical protein [Dactylosporangium sucinum]GGM59261.1 hypothetical protein GCM10007977_070930 [Dactylosporangium sucinum]
MLLQRTPGERVSARVVGRVMYHSGRLILVGAVLASVIAFLAVAGTLAFAPGRRDAAYEALVLSGTVVGAAGALIYLGTLLGGDRQS